MTLQAANGPRVQTLATPWPVVRRIEAALERRFDLDVCAQNETAKARRWFTVDDDGLAQTWHLETRSCLWWCNPPYDSIARWVGKGIETARLAGHCGVMLVPARTGMEWFLRCRAEEAKHRATVAFWPGRIAFDGSSGSPYEYSAVIGIGPGLSRLREIECGWEQPSLFSEVAP